MMCFLETYLIYGITFLFWIERKLIFYFLSTDLKAFLKAPHVSSNKGEMSCLSKLQKKIPSLARVFNFLFREDDSFACKGFADIDFPIKAKRKYVAWEIRTLAGKPHVLSRHTP